MAPCIASLHVSDCFCLLHFAQVVELLALSRAKSLINLVASSPEEELIMGFATKTLGVGLANSFSSHHLCMKH